MNDSVIQTTCLQGNFARSKLLNLERSNRMSNYYVNINRRSRNSKKVQKTFSNSQTIFEISKKKCSKNYAKNFQIRLTIPFRLGIHNFRQLKVQQESMLRELSRKNYRQMIVRKNRKFPVCKKNQVCRIQTQLNGFVVSSIGVSSTPDALNRSSNLNLKQAETY